MLLVTPEEQELATMPATREQAMDSEIAERSSAHCTTAEGELILDLGLCNSEGGFKDLYAALPPLLPPSSEPSVSPVSLSSPVRHSVPE